MMKKDFRNLNEVSGFPSGSNRKRETQFGFRRVVIAGLLLLLGAIPAHAQYNPIPNYNGALAGQQFRGAVNDRFSGAQPTSPKIVSLTFANLPAEQDGVLIYCSDCAKSIPCVGGGSGAFAFGQRGAWACAAPSTSAPVKTIAAVTSGAGQNCAGASTNGYTAGPDDQVIVWTGPPSSGPCRTFLPAATGSGRMIRLVDEFTTTLGLDPITAGTDTINGIGNPASAPLIGINYPSQIVLTDVAAGQWNMEPGLWAPAAIFNGANAPFFSASENSAIWSENLCTYSAGSVPPSYSQVCYSGLTQGNGSQAAVGQVLYSYYGQYVYGNFEGNGPPAAPTGAASDPSLTVVGTQAAAPVLAVKGAASQSGDLQDWKNSAGTTLAKVDSAGTVHANALNVIDATTYGVVCDGTTDNTTNGQNAINAAISGHARLRFPIGTCNYDHWVVSGAHGLVIEGSGSKTYGGSTTFFNSTATTQGACTTSGTTGGFQVLNSDNVTLQHLYFENLNSTLQSSCLVSLVGVTQDTNVQISDVTVSAASTSAGFGTDPIDIYSSHLTHFTWDNIELGGNAQYLWYMGGYSNAGLVSSLLLEGRPIYDIGNFAVFGASSNGVTFLGLDIEYQLNGLIDAIVGGLVNVKYAGDPPITCGVWKPGMTMTAPSSWTATTTTASCVEPVLTAAANAVITGNTHSNTTIDGINATVTTAWVGLPIHIVGGGPSGADLSTRIATMVSSSSVTIDTATSNTATGAYLSIPAYAGHVYIASTAGTASSTTVPTFPTSAGGTVTDNTGVWREIGPGAAIEAVQGATVIAGGYFGAVGAVAIYVPYGTTENPSILNNEILAPPVAGVVDFGGGVIYGGVNTGAYDSVNYWLGDGTHGVSFDFNPGDTITGGISASVTDLAYLAPSTGGTINGGIASWNGAHIANDSTLWSSGLVGTASYVSFPSVASAFEGTAAAASGFVRDVNAGTTVAARNAANSADIAELGTDASNDVLVGGTNAAKILLQNSATLSGGAVLASSGGTAPTVSSCGTSPGAVVGTNVAGHVTTGTSTTACTVAFSASGAFANAPDCTAADYNSHSVYLTAAPTTTGFTIGGLTAGDTIGWVCVGH